MHQRCVPECPARSLQGRWKLWDLQWIWISSRNSTSSAMCWSLRQLVHEMNLMDGKQIHEPKSQNTVKKTLKQCFTTVGCILLIHRTLKICFLELQPVSFNQHVNFNSCMLYYNVVYPGQNNTLPQYIQLVFFKFIFRCRIDLCNQPIYVTSLAIFNFTS